MGEVFFYILQVQMKKDNLQPSAPGIALNELDKMFYALDFLGPPAMVRIHFELVGGDVDIDLLRQAYAMEIKRRPVLNAVIADNTSGSGWQVRWMPRDAADPQQAVRFYDLSDLSADGAEAKFREILFDPFHNYNSRTDPPFFMALCKLTDQRHMLAAFFHHAVTDAHGYSVILKELFGTYNNMAARHPPEEAAIPGPCSAPLSLLPESRSERVIKSLGAVAVLVRRFIKNRGQIPVKINYGKNTFAGTTCAVQRALMKEQRARYVAAAKRAGVMLNDFLLTAQIGAIARWKRERGESCGLISLEVHKDLRTEARELQELSNKFSSFFISTHPRHRADLKTLLQHVRLENEEAQKQQTAEKLISFLWMLNIRLAGTTVGKLLNFIFNNPALGESFQVSNLGRLWAGPGNRPAISYLGDAEITAFYMAGPPMPSVGCFTTFVTYKQKLFISFNYFNWTMSATQAVQFVDIFEEELENLAGCI
jgi:NRPS condensation-like uncharacterized protein